MEQFKRIRKYETFHDEQGQLMWQSLDPPSKPAVYHYQARQPLLDWAATIGSYTYPREKGRSATDETAYLGAQALWGPSDENLLAILTETKPAIRPKSELEPFYYNGELVLDSKGRPMPELFNEVPLVLSSKFEAPYIEAIMRRNSAITYEDIAARMPHEKVNHKGEIKTGIKAQTLRRRTLAFRKRNHLEAWKAKHVAQQKSSDTHGGGPPSEGIGDEQHERPRKSSKRSAGNTLEGGPPSKRNRVEDPGVTVPSEEPGPHLSTEGGAHGENQQAPPLLNSATGNHVVDPTDSPLPTERAGTMDQI
ncbi:MAG: hypothetical protein Q9169_003417 [Polycauliona sp. 2 TL-2023]